MRWRPGDASAPARSRDPRAVLVSAVAPRHRDRLPSVHCEPPGRVPPGRAAPSGVSAGRGENAIVDLCSGGGGPWLSLLSQFEDDAPSVVLTGLHPNREAFERTVKLGGGRIGFEPESVDVMNVPSRLRGFRTVFAAFHHFRPGEARAILADAADKGCGIAIFEGTERRVSQLLSMVFLVPIVVLLATPFIRPFRWSRLAWTYLLPLAPLLIAFDGAVSCLRTYTEDEMRKLADGLGGESYHWRIGIERKGPAAISYAIGSPVQGVQTSR